MLERVAIAGFGQAREPVFVDGARLRHEPLRLVGRLDFDEASECIHELGIPGPFDESCVGGFGNTRLAFVRTKLGKMFFHEPKSGEDRLLGWASNS